MIPILFDGRINLTATNNGNDYGNYNSDEANAMMDEAAAETDLDAAAEKWAEVDAKLAEDVAYIPLDNQQVLLPAGFQHRELRERGVDERIPGPGGHLARGPRRLTSGERGPTSEGWWGRVGATTPP